MFRDFTKYEVFEDGRVYSYQLKRFLKPQKDKKGYCRLRLYGNNGERKDYLVHRVVWIAVNGEIPEGMEVNHINEDKSNCSIFNLNLMSRKENCNWGTRTARAAANRDYEEIGRKSAEKQTNDPKRSKQVAAYNKDGSLAMVFPSTQEAQRQGYNSGNVAACCRNCYIREGNNIYRGYHWLYFVDSPPLFYISA